MKRGSHWPRRATRRRVSPAELQLQLMAAKPVVLPEGADPELGKLFGINGDQQC